MLKDLLDNFSCNSDKDVLRTCLLHRENKERICFTVQYSWVGNDFLIAKWTSSGLSSQSFHHFQRP